MRRRLWAIGFAVVLALAALTGSSMVVAHNQLCTAAGYSDWTGYLVVFENDDEQWPYEDACSFDGNYGNASGPIQNFHDKLTGFHYRDRNGDNRARCIRFWRNDNYTGSPAFIANSGPMGGGQHFADAAVPAGFNDTADSHQWYPPQDGSCNYVVSGGGTG